MLRNVLQPGVFNVPPLYHITKKKVKKCFIRKGANSIMLPLETKRLPRLEEDVMPLTQKKATKITVTPKLFVIHYM